MIQKEIKEYLVETLTKLNYPTNEVEIIISNRADLCDYQYDGLFKLAKELHESPIKIGEKIVANLPSNDMFKKVELLPPGFINFTLSDYYINKILNNMINTPKYGLDTTHQERYFLDYGGPNIAKPLHVGHLRSAIVGESLKRILAYMGFIVEADVHLGDYGLQIGEVIYGLKKENISLDKVTLDDLERIYPEMSALCKENDEVLKCCQNITKELQDGNEEYNKYFKIIREISGNDILNIYKYLNVSFDYWFGESDAYPYLKEVEKDLINKKLLYKSEGAYVVDIKEDTDHVELPPVIFKKSNGAYLYASTDLATIYQRKKISKANHYLYVADNRQTNHYTGFFRIAKKLGIDIDFTFCGFGTVNDSDGKPFKTRNGKTPKLRDLFAEVKEIFLKSNDKNTDMKEKDLDILVNAIIKFADLQNNREKDYIFDIEKFSKVNGKTGPYTLYTYLRINKILKDIKTFNKLNNTVYNEFDRSLRIKILELPNALKRSVDLKLPSIIANYVYELCVNLNAFYENNHINNLDDIEKKSNWLTLLNLANNILKDMLNLLIIDIPDKM